MDGGLRGHRATGRLSRGARAWGVSVLGPSAQGSSPRGTALVAEAWIAGSPSHQRQPWRKAIPKGHWRGGHCQNRREGAQGPSKHLTRHTAPAVPGCSSQQPYSLASAPPRIHWQIPWILQNQPRVPPVSIFSAPNPLAQPPADPASVPPAPPVPHEQEGPFKTPLHAGGWLLGPRGPHHLRKDSHAGHAAHEATSGPLRAASPGCPVPSHLCARLRVGTYVCTCLCTRVWPSNQ